MIVPESAALSLIPVALASLGVMGTEDLFEDHSLPYLAALTATARGMTRSSSDAEDLVQDTYIKAYRAKQALMPGSNAKAWLLKIMTNLYIDRYRKAKRRPEVVEVADIDELAVYRQLANEEATPEAQVLASLSDSAVMNALDDLPDGYREVIVLADLEGLSYREIAEQLEVPIGTVMSRLHRGRRALELSLGAFAFEHGLTENPPPLGSAMAVHDRRDRHGNALPGECVALIEEVQGYLDGELDRDETAAFHEHIGNCMPCFKMASFKRDVRELVGERLSRARGSDQLADRIRGAVAALDAEGPLSS